MAIRKMYLFCSIFMIVSCINAMEQTNKQPNKQEPDSDTYAKVMTNAFMMQERGDGRKSSQHEGILSRAEVRAFNDVQLFCEADRKFATEFGAKRTHISEEKK